VEAEPGKQGPLSFRLFELPRQRGLFPDIQPVLWNFAPRQHLPQKQPFRQQVLSNFPTRPTLVSPQHAQPRQRLELPRTLPREERVLRMRFGIGMNTDHTLEEVGQQFSVTRERIRQIEAKALRKLKHPSRSRKLRSFLDN